MIGIIGRSGAGKSTLVRRINRLTITKARTEVMRYAFGWELFRFTLDSPFHGKSLGEPVGLALCAERVIQGKGNLAAILSDIWNNSTWRHGNVMWRSSGPS